MDQLPDLDRDAHSEYFYLDYKSVSVSRISLLATHAQCSRLTSARPQVALTGM
jgi:hypothetical protein